MPENPPNVLLTPLPDPNDDWVDWARQLVAVESDNDQTLVDAIQELSRRIAALEP